MFKLNFRIKNKLLLLVVFSTAIIFGAFLFATRKIFNKLSKDQSIEIVDSETEKFAALSKNYFDIDMGYVKALANSLQYMGDLSQNERDTIYGHQMLEMLNMNPKYISVWASMELHYYQEGYEKDHGRKLLVAMKENNNLIITEFFRDMDGRDESSDYTVIRANDEATLAEPYVDPDISDAYITSIIYPVHLNGEFAGLGGIDVPLSDMQGFINEIDITNGSIAYIISNTGIILGHSDTLVLGENIKDVYPELVKEHKIMEKIHNDTINGFTYILNDIPYYASVVPFVVDGTSTPWAISISRPLDQVLSQGKEQMTNLLILSALVLFLLFGVIIIYARSIAKPLKTASKVFAELAQGNLDDKLKLRKSATGDSLEALADSVNTLIDSLHKTENYALEIEKGNLDAEFKALSENDRLGNALIKMGQGLRDARQKEEGRRVEEERRRWSSDGLAKFAGLLRTDPTDFKKYCRSIISNLVKYTNSHQGGLYLINEENEGDKHIELAASYAYAGEKFIKERIEIGEGLIGTAIKEGKITFLCPVPENYLKISSGLGEHSPICLIIVPLKNNDEILGCIELSSLKGHEEYHKEFVTSVAESIAVTLSSIALHQKTNLLLEKTQMQAEEMMAQEEEMRQNLEEMMATQDGMVRKDEAIKQIIADLNINEADIKQKISMINNL